MFICTIFLEEEAPFGYPYKRESLPGDNLLEWDLIESRLFPENRMKAVP